MYERVAASVARGFPPYLIVQDLVMADFSVKPLEANLDFDNLPYWDVVIVGAGPAGLAASLTTAHRALTTLVVEAKGTPG